MKALLLIGGLGTRLRSVVPSLPKSLATLAGRPFLELLVDQLRSQNIRELIFCTGYLAEQIEETFKDGGDFGVTIKYSKEIIPMGTAGAIKLAQCHVEAEPEFLVLNGDSFLETDFNELLVFHRNHGGVATMAVVPVDNANRYGTVQVETTGRVSGFAEKNWTECAWGYQCGRIYFRQCGSNANSCDTVKSRNRRHSSASGTRNLRS